MLLISIPTSQKQFFFIANQCLSNKIDFLCRRYRVCIYTINIQQMPKYGTQNIYSVNSGESAGQLCASYLVWGLAALVFIVVIACQIMSIAVVIDYEGSQTFTQHNCTNISNYRIEKWNMFCERAVATTMDLTAGQNTTLYYPPIETWIPWKHSTARAWFQHLANLTSPFPCYIDYPKQIGITGYLSNITTYYIVCALSFLVVLVSVCVLCRYRTMQERRRGFYIMN